MTQEQKISTSKNGCSNGNDPSTLDKSSKTATNTKHEENKKKSNRNLKNSSPEYMTRIVIRQLPPTMTVEQFLEIVSPLSDYSEFYYVNGDLNLGEFAFSRAYIKFNNTDNVLVFKDKFDDYVFVDVKGNEYPAIVEYAPIQKLPRRFNSMNIKQDSRLNTIESDPDFLAFKERLENSSNTANGIVPTADQLLEQIESKESSSQITPLVEYLNQKRLEKIKTKEEKKRKKEESKKKKKEERKIEKEKKKDEKIQQQQQKETTDKPEQKVVILNKKDSTAPKFSKVSTPAAKMDVNSSKNEINNNKETKPKKTEINEKGDEKKDQEPKEKERIRNKDRPTREIYRPGMARQKLKTNDNANESGKANANSSNDNDLQGNQSSSSGTNQKPKSSNQAKYRERIFVRKSKN